MKTVTVVTTDETVGVKTAGTGPVKHAHLPDTATSGHPLSAITGHTKAAHDALGMGRKVVACRLTDPTVPLPDVGAIDWFRVSEELDGRHLVSVAAGLTSPASDAVVTLNIYNVATGSYMLSTPVTIDVGEKDSTTAAVAAVIDADHNAVTEAAQLRTDLIVSSSSAKGLMLDMIFE